MLTAARPQKLLSSFCIRRGGYWSSMANSVMGSFMRPWRNIIEQIVYLYLTSPFDTLREAFSGVLSVWSGTRVGIKAAHLILSLSYKPAMLTDTSTMISFSSTFEKKYHHIMTTLLSNTKKAE